jgi:hypothetical protein
LFAENTLPFQPRVIRQPVASNPGRDGRMFTCCNACFYADFKMCLMPRMGMMTQSGRLFNS